MADILQSSYNGTRKTDLMNRCNLAFRQLKSYLDFMVKKDLLRAVVGDGNSNRGLFEITSKGKEFLRVYRSLKDLMNSGSS
jgi:predicted transcriptional regulator